MTFSCRFSPSTNPVKGWIWCWTSHGFDKKCCGWSSCIYAFLAISLWKTTYTIPNTRSFPKACMIWRVLKMGSPMSPIVTIGFNTKSWSWHDLDYLGVPPWPRKAPWFKSLIVPGAPRVPGISHLHPRYSVRVGVLDTCWHWWIAKFTDGEHANCCYISWNTTYLAICLFPARCRKSRHKTSKKGKNVPRPFANWKRRMMSEFQWWYGILASASRNQVDPHNMCQTHHFFLELKQMTKMPHTWLWIKALVPLIKIAGCYGFPAPKIYGHKHETTKTNHKILNKLMKAGNPTITPTVWQQLI